MLTLVLVVGLCSDVGCDYMDVTHRFPEVTNDAQCVQMAGLANQMNIDSGEAPRFACLQPETFAKMRKREM